MGLLNHDSAECRNLRDQLENAAGAAPSASAVAELLAAAPAALQLHVKDCADCQEAAENILATRALLSSLPSSADAAGPWFVPRVMAAIAASKAELARAADTWTFLPKLASRLTWASSVALLLASAWLYQRPVNSTPASPRVVATDITGEPLVDTTAQPAADDELLLSSTEQPR